MTHSGGFRIGRLSSLPQHTYCFQNCKSNCAKVMGEGPASDLDVLTFADFPWPASLFPSLTDSIFSLPIFAHPFNYCLHQPHQSSPQSHTLLWGELIACEIAVHVKYRLKAEQERQGGLVKCCARSTDGTCYLHACTHKHTHKHI